MRLDDKEIKKRFFVFNSFRIVSAVEMKEQRGHVDCNSIENIYGI
jgi:hypothetical protein